MKVACDPFCLVVIEPKPQGMKATWQKLENFPVMRSRNLMLVLSIMSLTCIAWVNSKPHMDTIRLETLGFGPRWSARASPGGVSY